MPDFSSGLVHPADRVPRGFHGWGDPGRHKVNITTGVVGFPTHTAGNLDQGLLRKDRLLVGVQDHQV